MDSNLTKLQTLVGAIYNDLEAIIDADPDQLRQSLNQIKTDLGNLSTRSEESVSAVHLVSTELELLSDEVEDLRVIVDSNLKFVNSKKELYVSSTKKNFHDAAADCKKRGMQLLELTVAPDSKVIFKFRKKPLKLF